MNNNNNRPALHLLWTLLLICSLSLTANVAAQETPMRLTADAVAKAQAYLQSLDAGQRQTTQYAFDSDERLNWHFIPRDRNGLSINAMNETQREQASAVLQTLLGDTGYHKLETIRSLETVLKAIEVNPRFNRDPNNYYFTVFGTPSLEGSWAFRFEGHHIALNWTFVEGQGLASTPQFFGSNPAEVRNGPKTGLRVLGREEDMARQLIESMSSAQRLDALVQTRVPGDILTAAQVEISPLEDSGIAYSALDATQQGLLMGIIEEFAAAQSPVVAQARLQNVRADLNAIKFTWIGSMARGDAHYYRIQGPAFLIEYDNTQNEANHVHSVWRDFNGDFGRDLIRLHYADVAAVFGPGHQH